MPNLSDKLMVGVFEEERGELLLRWTTAECVGDSQVLISDGNGEEEDLPANWMLKSDFQQYFSNVKVLNDAEVNEDEDLNLDEIKRMRGEVPSARKPWGTAKKKLSKMARRGGLPRRYHTFDAHKPIGLHINSKTMQVEDVDRDGQGCNVRCGWRLVEVDGEVCRSGEDLRLALKKHNLDTSSNNEVADMTNWVFEVPPATSTGTGPSSAVPFSVVSGQVVKLAGLCDSTCKTSGCKHLPKIAFRLDPNHKYFDLSQQDVEPLIRYYPEGIEKRELMMEGDFPQCGGRVPQFGEPFETMQAALVHIDTFKTSTFPRNVHNKTRLTETHGAFPDPSQPLNDDPRQSMNLAKTIVSGRLNSQSKQMDRQRRLMEEKVIQSTRELTALKRTEVTAIEKTCHDQVKDAQRQAEYYRTKALKLERELTASHQRPLPPPSSVSQPMQETSQKPSTIHTSLCSTEMSTTLPSPPKIEVVTEAGQEVNDHKLPSEGSNQMMATVAMTKKAAVTLKQKGWWDRMHGRHASHLEKRETMRLEGEEKRRLEEEAELNPTIEKEVETRTQARLKAKVRGTHLEREQSHLNRRSVEMDQTASCQLSEEVPGKEPHTTRLVHDLHSSSEVIPIHHQKMKKKCQDCGSSFRPPPCNPRSLKKGTRVEASHRTSREYEAIGDSTFSPQFLPGTVICVRSTRCVDVLFDPPSPPSNVVGSFVASEDIGVGRKETNIDPNCVRLLIPWSCMCKTRKSLGYNVAPMSQAMNNKDYVNKTTSTSTTNPLHTGSSTQAYRGTGTCLAKTWTQLEAADKTDRKCRQSVMKEQAKEKVSTSTSDDFAARQRAWDEDRKALAEEKRKKLDAQLMTPDFKHLHKSELSKLGKDKTKAVSTTSKEISTLPSETLPQRLQSDYEPEMISSSSSSLNNKNSSQSFQSQVKTVTTTKNAIHQLKGKVSGMEARWEQQAQLRMQKELMSIGYTRQEVMRAIELMWEKMNKKLKLRASGEENFRKKSSSTLQHNTNKQASSIGNYPVSERNSLIKIIQEQTLKYLISQQPGNHIVGEVVKVLDEDTIMIMNSSYNTTPTPQNYMVRGSELIGLVKSYDATNRKYLLKLFPDMNTDIKRQANTLVSVDVSKIEILDKTAAQLFLSTQQKKHKPREEPRNDQTSRYDLDRLNQLATSLTTIPASQTVTNKTDLPSSSPSSSAIPVKFLTSAAKGRLQTLQKQEAVELLQLQREEKRKKKQHKLREILGQHKRETNNIRRQIVQAQANGNKTGDREEVVRLEKSLNDHLNKNIYNKLIRPSQSSGFGGDDELMDPFDLNYGGGCETGEIIDKNDQVHGRITNSDEHDDAAPREETYNDDDGDDDDDDDDDDDSGSYSEDENDDDGSDLEGITTAVTGS